MGLFSKVKNSSNLITVPHDPTSSSDMNLNTREMLPTGIPIEEVTATDMVSSLEATIAFLTDRNVEIDTQTMITSTLRSKYDNSQAELKEKDKVYAELQKLTEIRAKKQAKADKENKSQQTHLLEQNTKLQNEVDKLRLDNSKQKEAVSELEKTKAEQALGISKLTKVVSEFSDTIAQQKSQIENSAKEKNKTEQENKQRRIKLEKEIANLQGELRQLRTVNKKLEILITSLTSDKQEVEDDLKSHKEEISTLQKTKDEQTLQISELTKKNLNLSANVKCQSAKIENCLLMIKQLGLEIKESTAENLRLSISYETFSDIFKTTMNNKKERIKKLSLNCQLTQNQNPENQETRKSSGLGGNTTRNFLEDNALKETSLETQNEIGINSSKRTIPSVVFDNGALDTEASGLALVQQTYLQLQD